jgi:hypothetical protein
VKLQYVVDGKLIKNPSVNSLSGVAYFHTKGIGGQDRVPTARLEELLKASGAEDPRRIPFSVDLPNGKRLEGVLPQESE